jgi:hypothetical protein
VSRSLIFRHNHTTAGVPVKSVDRTKYLVGVKVGKQVRKGIVTVLYRLVNRHSLRLVKNHNVLVLVENVRFKIRVRRSFHVAVIIIFPGFVMLAQPYNLTCMNNVNGADKTAVSGHTALCALKPCHKSM